MDIERIIENLEQRVQKLEDNQTFLFDRMGKVEDKTDSAWHTLRETKGEIATLKQEVEELKADVKQMKSEQASMSRKLTAIMVILSVLGVICLGFFVYIWRHDTELAKSILTLGTTIGTIVA